MIFDLQNLFKNFAQNHKNKFVPPFNLIGIIPPCAQTGLDVMQAKKIPPFSLSTSVLRGELRPYQLEGVNFLIRLFDCGINGVLADEMVCPPPRFKPEIGEPGQDPRVLAWPPPSPETYLDPKN